MKIASPGFRAPTPSFLSACLAGLFAALLAGCGQEPGQTGLDYLQKQGIRIAAPLYHLSFDDLPVDSVFATEAPLNHFGESLLVVGRESGYAAKARLGFQITTKAQRDSLVHGLHLRLTSIPVTNDFAGRTWLRTAVRGRDSLSLLVESFSWPDSTNSFGDSLSAFHRRILVSPVPFSTLDPRFKRRDTVRVALSAAYPDSGAGPADSSQTGALPHLWDRLRNGGGSDTARRWTVHLEISPLTPSDSGMFRFIALAAGNATVLRRYNSGLWLGRHSKDSLFTVGTLLTPYLSSNGFAISPAANYETRFDGASTRSLLHGVARGVHFRINRDTLLARIRLKLNAITPGLGNRLLDSGGGLGGNFDRRFYVPYAEMRLPIDHALTRVDGPFALDMAASSDVDSLGADTASFQDDLSVPLGDSVALTVHGGNPSGSAATEVVVVSYRVHPIDGALRQVVTRWARDGAVADSFTVTPDGRHREILLRRRAGWAHAATLSVKPGAGQLRVEVYFNVSSVAEPRHIVDSTGRVLTGNASQSRRYWRPGADSLNVRVTRGLRGLLNRVHTPGTGIAPDLFLRSVERATFDTTTIGSSRYLRVVYPVFGEIDFKRAGNGRLEVGLELYLYPLEAGQ